MSPLTQSFSMKKQKEANPTRNLLIDYTYMPNGQDLSNSLAIYGSRLIQGFQRYGHYCIHVLLWRDTEAYLDKLVGGPFNKIVLDKKDVPARCRRSYNRLRGILPPGLTEELERRKIEKVLLPAHLNSIFHFRRPFTHYVIIHDLFYHEVQRALRGRLSFLKWRTLDFLSIWMYRHLITISNVTHDEVRRFTGRESQVLYNSLPFSFNIPEETVESICGKPYILDINSLQERKNTEVLIRAMDLLKESIPHILYLKVGRFYPEVRLRLEQLVSDLGLQDRVLFDTDYRSEGEIRYLYAHADLFVSPSLKEGFGWTPIEAAILKTPVLVSDIEIYQEVTCGKIPTFNPHAPEDLAAHILEILDNPPSLEERTELADFFLETYSQKKQIERLEAILA